MSQTCSRRSAYPNNTIFKHWTHRSSYSESTSWKPSMISAACLKVELKESSLLCSCSWWLGGAANRMTPPPHESSILQTTSPCLKSTFHKTRRPFSCTVLSPASPARDLLPDPCTRARRRRWVREGKSVVFAPWAGRVFDEKMSGRTCEWSSACNKQAYYAEQEGELPKFCHIHKSNNSVDVRKKR